MSETTTAQDRPAEQEEWTRVKSKSKFRRAPRNVIPKTPAANPSADGPHDHKSVAEIHSEFENFRARWHESDAHKRLAALIETNKSAHQPIHTAICLGVGTFDLEDGGWDARRRTYIQLAAFLDMVELLSKSSSEPIRCVFQEPRFTANDKEFLESIGHQVVESPGAFEAVEPNSLLFAIHMYRPIYEAALATLPAMFVGTGWETWDDVGNLKEGDFQCMQDMHASHKLLSFPQDGTHTTFSSTCLYWRPAAKTEGPSAQDGKLTEPVPPQEAEANSRAGNADDDKDEERKITGSKQADLIEDEDDTRETAVSDIPC